ncbi:MAG: hypothetical protein L0H10_27585 [Comamonas sp.]|uniref:hypothetical protein n=1 Tax=Comamonas sp. TaxID=34028 RepID=UPI00264954A5|nr:hypothetical protein [Comamonas sp.]MDN5507543.1 hypothetical protein [Comamonas sp.]MDN5536118.1 hypothetical protein [Comamonas sp.]
MRLAIILLALLPLAGCETMKILTATKLQPTAPKTDVGILQLVGDPDKQLLVWGDRAVNNGGVVEACKPVDPQIAAASAAIWAPIAARVVIDAAGSAATRYVKKMKAQASKSLSFKAVVSSDHLATATCLIVYRGPTIDMAGDGLNFAIPKKKDGSDDFSKKPKPQPNALVVMRIERHIDSLRLVPIYAYAKNSISLTKCAGDCSLIGQEKGKISVSVAITGTAVVSPSGNDIKLRDIGTATLTVKDVPLGGDGTASKGGSGSPIGDRSAFLAVPANGTSVQLSVGMTESGDIAGDPDVAAAEILAATAALSEGSLAEIKAHYDREAAD